MHPLVGGEKSLQVRIHIEQVQFLWNINLVSFTSEIATAVFSLFSMELYDRGVLPSNDTFLK